MKSHAFWIGFIVVASCASFAAYFLTRPPLEADEGIVTTVLTDTAKVKSTQTQPDFPEDVDVRNLDNRAGISRAPARKIFEEQPIRGQSPQSRTKVLVSNRPDTRSLVDRAAQVEYEANRRLAQLSQKLELTEHQQDQIFPMLAKASPSFHPALQPEGAQPVSEGSIANPIQFVPGSDSVDRIEPGNSANDGASDAVSPSQPDATENTAEDSQDASDQIVEDSTESEDTIEEQIYDELDSEQQLALEDDMIDQQLWWQEVLENLENDLEASTPDSGILAGTENPEENSGSGQAVMGPDLDGEESEKSTGGLFGR